MAAAALEVRIAALDLETPEPNGKVKNDILVYIHIGDGCDFHASLADFF
jgi:hypothetical protein